MAMTPPATTTPTFTQQLKDLISIDIRSLALIRIGVALTVLCDLYIRSASLTAHYSAYGVYPLSLTLSDLWKHPTIWSLHALYGGPTLWVGFLFALQAFFAVQLLIGHRTRLSTAVVWILLVSLHHANPLVLFGADAVLRMTLFVGMFLPLGASYSVDASLGKNPHFPVHYRSAWSAAYLLQLGLLYVFAVQSKIGAEWSDWSAGYYALRNYTYATQIGDWLLQFPHFLAIGSHSIVILQIVAFPLLFSPLYNNITRTVALVALLAMHAFLGTVLNIGIFSPIIMIALLGFIPTSIWDRVSGLLRKRFPKVTIYYDGDCGFCFSSVRLIRTFLALPNCTLAKAQEVPHIWHDVQKYDSWVIETADGNHHFAFNAGVVLVAHSPIFFIFAPIGNIAIIRRIGHWIYRYVAKNRLHICSEAMPTKHTTSTTLRLFVESLAVFYIVFIVFWQIERAPNLGEHIQRYKILDAIGYTFRIDANWHLFAENLSSSGWVVPMGTFANGHTFDLRDSSVVSIIYIPKYITSHDHVDARWEKYYEKLSALHLKSMDRYYARYLCRTWNSEHPANERIVSVRIVFMKEDFTKPNEQRVPARQERYTTQVCRE